MRFKITAKEDEIERMCKDLDKEKEKVRKMTGHGAFKAASRLVQTLIGTPMLITIDYKKLDKRTLELTVLSTAQAYMKEQTLAGMIMKRARQYGSDVVVKAL